jgi:hypothetical protein
MNEKQDQIPPLDVIYSLEYEVLKADAVKAALHLSTTPNMASMISPTCPSARQPGPRMENTWPGW